MNPISPNNLIINFQKILKMHSVIRNFYHRIYFLKQKIIDGFAVFPITDPPPPHYGIIIMMGCYSLSDH